MLSTASCPGCQSRIRRIVALESEVLQAARATRRVRREQGRQAVAFAAGKPRENVRNRAGLWTMMPPCGLHRLPSRSIASSTCPAPNAPTATCRSSIWANGPVSDRPAADRPRRHPIQHRDRPAFVLAAASAARAFIPNKLPTPRAPPATLSAPSCSPWLANSNIVWACPTARSATSCKPTAAPMPARPPLSVPNSVWPGWPDPPMTPCSTPCVAPTSFMPTKPVRALGARRFLVPHTEILRDCRKNDSPVRILRSESRDELVFLVAICAA